MKIIAQSISVSGAPYAHLGYLAATSSNPDPKLIGASNTALLLGILLAGLSFVGIALRPRVKCWARVVLTGVLLAAAAWFIFQAARLRLEAHANPREIPARPR